MNRQFYLVTDATAEEVERRTGLQGHNTHLGALVETPTPFDLGEAMARLDRLLHPNRCTCGAYAVFHRPGCPAAYWGTI
jgi:hypothetical protein